jgi:hypothetical protein
MTRPLQLDRAKAAAIAAVTLERRPELAARLARAAGSEQAWRIRASLDEDGMVTLTAMVGGRVGVGLAYVPRELVERDRSRPQ